MENNKIDIDPYSEETWEENVNKEEFLIEFARYFLFKKDYQWNQFHLGDIDSMEDDCTKKAQQLYDSGFFKKRCYVVREYGSKEERKFEYK
jgi:hypothetical protein